MAELRAGVDFPMPLYDHLSADGGDWPGGPRYGLRSEPNECEWTFEERARAAEWKIGLPPTCVRIREFWWDQPYFQLVHARSVEMHFDPDQPISPSRASFETYVVTAVRFARYFLQFDLDAQVRLACVRSVIDG